MKKDKKFYSRKLDDQAKIFSLSFNKKDVSIFRLSVILKENINPQILQQALLLALAKYRVFKVKMKKGFFWYYFNENEKNPVVSIEEDYPFKKINTKENNNYLFKVTYFKKKINIDFFHTLTDGNNGKDFFNEIICRYLELKYSKDLEEQSNKKDGIIKESENSYKKIYTKNIRKTYGPPKAYLIKGDAIKDDKVSLTHFNIVLNELRDYAKFNDCTLSMLLVAMLAYSIYETNFKIYKGKKPINICVPINLKKYFPSETVSNFVSYMVVSLNLKHNQEYSFNDILMMVKNKFEKKLKLNKIIATMTSNGKKINNFFVRIVPLILKRFMVKLGSLEVKRHFTTTFSNLGKLEIDNKYAKYIEKYFFILAPDWAEKIRCGVCSFQDNLVVTFGTNLNNSDIQNKFRYLLKDLKIKYNVNEN